MAQDPAFGLYALSKNIFNGGNSSRGELKSSQDFSSTATGAIIAARVKHIILTKDDVNFSNFGEWNGIGTIFWEPITQPINKSGYDVTLFASPLFPNIKHYPLLEELVYLIQLPTTNIQGNLTANGYYYFPPLNTWNSQHHNALPSFGNDFANNDPKQTVDYSSTQKGEVRRVTDDSTEINLGSTFKERINIHPLLPFEGDVIYEGRWGNSIRFGSTVPTSTNNWSTSGKSGDPIVIIRNGQTNYTSDPWVPETEKIETDLSSIYLTSTQKLSIPPITTGKTFTYQAIDSKSYDKNQITLMSGRVFLGAKTDSIVLKADKPIQISSNTAVNIGGSKQIALDANEILLGLDSTSQPVVLGNELKNTLLNIATILKGVGTSLQGAVDSNAAPIAACQSAGAILAPACDDMINALNSNSILSKKVKTI